MWQKNKYRCLIAIIQDAKQEDQIHACTTEKQSSEHRLVCISPNEGASGSERVGEKLESV